MDACSNLLITYYFHHIPQLARGICLHAQSSQITEEHPKLQGPKVTKGVDIDYLPMQINYFGSSLLSESISLWNTFVLIREVPLYTEVA